MLDSRLTITNAKTRKPVAGPILYARVSSLGELALAAVANQLLLPGAVRSKDLTRYKKPWGQDDEDCPNHRTGPGGCYTMEIGGWKDGRRQGRVVFWHAVVCLGTMALCNSPSHRGFCARENPPGLWVSVLDYGDGNDVPKVQETQPFECSSWGGTGPLLFRSCGTPGPAGTEPEPVPILRAYAYLVIDPKAMGLSDDAPLLGDFFYGSRDGKRVRLEPEEDL